VKRHHALAGFAVSLLLIGWLVRGVEWSQVRLAFAEVRLGWVGLIAAIVIVRLAIHAFRWSFLLRPVHPLGLGLCFRATSVGFLSTVFLPAHGGAVVRAVVAGEGGRVPASSVFATVVLERLIGTLLLLPLLLVILGVVEPPQLGPATKISLRLGVGFSGASVIGVGMVLWGLARARRRTLGLLRRALAFLPASWVERIAGGAESFVDGLKGLPAGRDLAAFTALSVLMWGCWLASNLFLFQAVGLALPLSAAFMLMLLQFLSFSLPAGPGVLGTYHVAATMGGLLLYGLPSSHALSAAVVLRVALTATVVLVGLGCLLVESALAGRPVRLGALARAEVTPEGRESV
jgi:uncharacterized protein (TIRG00374 family)